MRPAIRGKENAFSTSTIFDVMAVKREKSTSLSIRNEPECSQERKMMNRNVPGSRVFIPFSLA